MQTSFALARPSAALAALCPPLPHMCTQALKFKDRLNERLVPIDGLHCSDHALNQDVCAKVCERVTHAGFDSI
jgi:hypothetical protein